MSDIIVFMRKKLNVSLVSVLWLAVSSPGFADKFKTKTEQKSEGAYQILTNTEHNYDLIKTKSQNYFVVGFGRRVLHEEFEKTFNPGMDLPAGKVKAGISGDWTIEDKADSSGFFPEDGHEKNIGWILKGLLYWTKETGCCNAPDTIKYYGLTSGKLIFQTETHSAVALAEIDNKTDRFFAFSVDQKDDRFGVLTLSDSEKVLQQVDIKIDPAKCCDLSDPALVISLNPKKNFVNQLSMPSSKDKISKLYIKLSYDTGEITVPSDGNSLMVGAATAKGGLRLGSVLKN